MYGVVCDESFVVALQAQFIQTPQLLDVLRLVSNIKDENVSTSTDDGVSQVVGARVGIVRMDNVTVPNPVTLAPYRTFSEVPQPESQFVLRLKSGMKDGEMPTVALFEADGGAWQVKAINNIALHLASLLPTDTMIVG